MFTHGLNKGVKTMSASSEESNVTSAVAVSASSLIINIIDFAILWDSEILVDSLTYIFLRYSTLACPVIAIVGLMLSRKAIKAQEKPTTEIRISRIIGWTAMFISLIMLLVGLAALTHAHGYRK